MTLNKKSFVTGLLSGFVFLALMNATLSVDLAWYDPNIVLKNKAVAWLVSNISPLFGDLTANTVTSNGRLKSDEHEIQPLTETERLELIQESGQTGAIFFYAIEDASAEIEIGLGHIENGIDYRWEILDATATIALTTDTFRVAANGMERGIASVMK